MVWSTLLPSVSTATARNDTNPRSGFLYQRQPIASGPPRDHALPRLTVVIGDFDGQRRQPGGWCAGLAFDADRDRIHPGAGGGVVVAELGLEAHRHDRQQHAVWPGNGTGPEAPRGPDLGGGFVDPLGCLRFHADFRGAGRRLVQDVARFRGVGNLHAVPVQRGLRGFGADVAEVTGRRAGEHRHAEYQGLWELPHPDLTEPRLGQCRSEHSCPPPFAGRAAIERPPGRAMPRLTSVRPGTEHLGPPLDVFRGVVLDPGRWHGERRDRTRWWTRLAPRPAEQTRP